MRALIAWCVRRYGAVSALTVLALALGCWGALHAPLDVFPEFVPSQVDIQTEAPGFSPQQVEELVTRQVENAVNGASGLATLRSESIPGLSTVTVTFADGIDLHVARQGISERLSELGSSLPTGVGVPKLSPLVSSTMDLLKIGLVSDKVDAFALRDAADWVIKPRLLAVPGVAHVIVFGGSVRQIRIQPDMRRLTSFGITLTDVADAARAALALRGAGFIDMRNQRVLLQSPIPEPDVAALAAALVVVRSGVPVRLGDIASVSVAPALRSGDSLIMGRPRRAAVAGQPVRREYAHHDPRGRAGAGQSATSAERPGHQRVSRAASPRQFHRAGARRPEAITADRGRAHLRRALPFLRDLRAALIAFTAIPLSLLAAVAVLDRMGLTLNTMTLGGFAVALGVLVDDAIVGIENIMRRLRENPRLPRPLPRLAVIEEASLEVRGPVIYATLVVIAVFLPEIFTASLQGRFVGPLALAFIFAVSASLLVAMTATPALCALLLRRDEPRAESGWLRRLKDWQGRAVHGVGSHFRIVIAVLAACVIAAAAALPFLGGTFMPDFREGHLVMQGFQFDTRNIARPDAERRRAHQCGRARAALRRDHFPAGRSG